MAACLGPGSGQIAQRAIGQLKQECLGRRALGADAVTVVQKQLKGIGGKGHVVQPQEMGFNLEDGMLLLKFAAGQGPGVNVHGCAVIKTNGLSRAVREEGLQRPLRLTAFRPGDPADRQPDRLDQMGQA